MSQRIPSAAKNRKASSRSTRRVLEKAGSEPYTYNTKWPVSVARQGYLKLACLIAGCIYPLTGS